MNNESYVVLSRKYRPQSFKDMIGQDVLIHTLSNAIARNKIAHAFLFHGIRGIGKTTTARILARALNCIGLDGNGGPNINPCGKCDHCVAILSDRHHDVIEMDAASKTSVNDIRDIIESCAYRPVTARYKIFIIDEVHMLSNSAFNALLKTLEEPPGHTKFILATTEINKIPVTILSRCQRFDLSRYTVQDLASYLKVIGEKEAVQIENGALNMIALYSGGSARDALSILDQAVSYNDAMITEDSIRSMLGLSSMHDICDLFEHGCNGEVREMLEMLSRMYKGGGNPKNIIQDTLTLIHHIIKNKHIEGNEAILGQEITGRVRKLSKLLDSDFLIYSWQILISGFKELNIATNAIYSLEMIFLKICHLTSARSLKDSAILDNNSDINDNIKKK